MTSRGPSKERRTSKSFLAAGAAVVSGGAVTNGEDSTGLANVTEAAAPVDDATAGGAAAAAGGWRGRAAAAAGGAAAAAGAAVAAGGAAAVGAGKRASVAGFQAAASAVDATTPDGFRDVANALKDNFDSMGSFSIQDITYGLLLLSEKRAADNDKAAQEKCEDLFKIFDSENRGSITRDDLATVLTKLNPEMKSEHVDKIFSTLISSGGDAPEAEGGGEIKWKDFLEFIYQPGSTPVPGDPGLDLVDDFNADSKFRLWHHEDVAIPDLLDKCYLAALAYGPEETEGWSERVCRWGKSAAAASRDSLEDFMAADAEKRQGAAGSAASPTGTESDAASDEAAKSKWENALRKSLAEQGSLELVTTFRKGGFQKPAHFIAKGDKRVVLAIRGTYNRADIMTDLHCDQEIIRTCSGSEVTAKAGADRCHQAHGGFANGAKWVMDSCADKVIELMEEKGDDAELEVVGHSLGAAVASLTFLHLRGRLMEKGRNPDKMHCWGFATPPCVTEELAEESAEMGITAVVLQDDIVPRLTLHSADGLRDELVALEWTPHMKARYTRLASTGTGIEPERIEAAGLRIAAGGAAVGSTIAGVGGKAMGGMRYMRHSLTGASAPSDALADGQVADGPVSDAEPADDFDSKMKKAQSQELRSPRDLGRILRLPGRVAFIRRSGSVGYVISEAPRERFKRIELSDTMLGDHKISSYHEGLTGLHSGFRT